MTVHLFDCLLLLLSVSVKSLLLGFLAGGALWCLRVRSCEIQHRVWAIVLAAMLLLPALEHIAPTVPLPAGLRRQLLQLANNEASPVSLFREFGNRADPTDDAAKAVPARSIPSRQEAANTSHETTENADMRAADGGGVLPRLAERPLRARSLPEHRRTAGVNWATVLVTVYVVGFSAFLTRFFMGLRAVRKLLRRGRQLDRKLSTAGIVLQTDAVRVPVSTGVFRPCILLPEDWPSWSREMLTSVLSHEEAHIRRKDYLVTILAELNRCLFWFHPLAWFLRGQLARLAEMCCDDRVIGVTGNRSCYAQHILAMANRLMNDGRRVVPLAVSVARKPNVESRIDAILDPGRPLARRLGWCGILLLVGTLSPIVVGVAGIAVDNREASPKSARTVTVSEDYPRANTLTGRVVDESGRPIPNVLIEATPLKSRGIHQALILKARADETGRYTFSGTIVGEEYLLEFYKGGFAYRTDKKGGFTYRKYEAKKGKEEVAVTVLQSLPTHRLSGKITHRDTGESVSGAQVVLVGLHEYVATVVSTAAGDFRFDDVPQNAGQAVLFAKKDKDRSAFQLIGPTLRSVDLTLDAPGRIKGTVVSETSGNPIGGCTVTIRPPFVSGYSVETITKEDGTFEVGDLPAGEYVVLGTHSEWFCPWSRLRSAEVEIRAGKTEFHEIEMLKKATIFGKVLGPVGHPVSGATVAVPTAMKRDGGKLFDVTKTDKTGRFELRTGWLARLESHSRPTVWAVADGMGTGSASISGLKEGAIRKRPGQEVVIRLSGAMRVEGHMKDPDGNPIPGVYVYVHPNLWPRSRTDEKGYFALTSFPLPVSASEKFPVYFRTPRPHDGEVNSHVSAGVRKPARIPKAGTQYFLHDKVQIAAKHEGKVVLNRILTPTDLLTLTGKVTDSAGRPIDRANLMLFVGNGESAGISDPNWVKDMHPELRIGNSGFLLPMYVPLCRTVTDEQGRYKMSVARESAQSLSIRYHGRTIDPTRFSLGVDSLRGQRRLLPDIRFAKAEKQKTLNVQFPRTTRR